MQACYKQKGTSAPTGQAGRPLDAISRRPNLSFRVTRELGPAIVCGDCGSADSLPTVAELCLEFAVSRAAVREAVKMLSAKGWVSSKARQGIRILPVRPVAPPQPYRNPVDARLWEYYIVN